MEFCRWEEASKGWHSVGGKKLVRDRVLLMGRSQEGSGFCRWEEARKGRGFVDGKRLVRDKVL